ncbi:hypothetical protein [Tsuneonella amylolytica]|uniref:hypothetical protein n=1 Tax=Tsuneonella amylolytica TaxID=2338327 RepID=UPI000EA86292|nr:hypothetical protein [Tsuneonella amylolytica]
MTRSRTISCIGAALALSLCAPAAAAEPDPADAPPAPLFEAVTACRAVADTAARLACYDRTVAALAAAEAGREVVVLDRAGMRKTRERLFGINMPQVRLFGRSDTVEDADVVQQISSTIKAMAIAPDGLPVFLLADGGRWKQTDGRNVFPRVGHTITIKHGILNKYTASINGRAGVRVIRLLD